MQDHSKNQHQKHQNKAKPYTGAFQLETKIRVIIQDVMSATVRKLSQFNQKMENFQGFFFTYKQRMNEMEDLGKTNEQNINKITQNMNKNKLAAQTEMLRLEQMIQKIKIEKKQQDVVVKDINKRLSTLTRQSENMNSQLSKTKAKFIEVTDQISALKEDVAYKISKYVQQTAETNTQIKIHSEEIKKEYFNVCLALQKNKQRYDQIIAQRDNQENFNKKIADAIDGFREQLSEEKLEMKKMNTKIDEMDTAVYGKIKTTEAKLLKRIVDLEESNLKILQSVKKVETFSELLEEIREDGQKIRRQLLKKFEESDAKQKDKIEQEMLKINKSILEYEKIVDKKVKHISESQQKSIDFLTQKMEYLKLEIETQLSSKTSKLLQEKSKSESGANNLVVEEFRDKIQKLTLQTSKAVVKMEATVKQVQKNVKKQFQDVKEEINDKVTNSMKIVEQSVKGGIDPEFLEQIHRKIEDTSDRVDLKLFQMNKELSEQNLRVLKVEKLKEQTIDSFKEMKASSEKQFGDLEQKITNKVEKVMFLVTKMRGDAIIKNQFTEKQIKQLKRSNEKNGNLIAAINKLLPAFGQCINLVMCLIYDAEYHHSRIIQDSLGGATNTAKFQNLLEGVLYEFSDKKKAGVIIYRHKQYKKTDIVKMTFQAYTEIWEELYENYYHQKSELIPKTFYKNSIEKSSNRVTKTGNSPRKEVNSTTINSKQHASHSFIKGNTVNLNEEGRNSFGEERVENNDPLNTSVNNNKSFHIRKKKNNLIKSKDDSMIMVVAEDKESQGENEKPGEKRSRDK